MEFQIEIDEHNEKFIQNENLEQKMQQEIRLTEQRNEKYEKKIEDL